MAGSYPDVPGPRIAYHLDGSVIAMNTENAMDTPVVGSSTQAGYLNDENDGTDVDGIGGGTWGAHTFVFFAQKMDLTGYFIAYRQSSGTGAPSAVDYSTNTTNGVDGTWSSWASSPPAVQNNMVSYRSAIQTPTAITGVKAIRITHGSLYTKALRSVHLYGTPNSSASLDRLELWHPTLNQSLNVTPAFFDWGDVARSTTQTKQFRVKNQSSTLTANSVVGSLNVLYDSASAFADAHQFSNDGTTYTSTISIGSIAPGAICSVRYVRFSPSGSQPLSIWSGWVQAVAGSWT